MERIILTEVDADEFLESIGVTLYENTMTIGETEVSGIDGQSALQEHGIFLYEDGIIVEGDQAEAYKARKAKEAEDAKKTDSDRRKYRYNFNGQTYSRLTGSKTLSKKDDNGEFIQYKGNGEDKSDYSYISDTDKDRALKTRDIYHKQVDRARTDAEIAYGTRLHGPRYFPGKFKGREDELYNDFKNKAKRFDNLAKYGPEARDALNRHMRRHPNQYKESCGIFSSVAFI